MSQLYIKSPRPNGKAMGKYTDMLSNESEEVLVNDEKFSRMSKHITKRSLRGMMRRADVKSF